MRILIVSTARHFGGTERWASLITAELSKRHEVFVGCSSEDVGARIAQGRRIEVAPDIASVRRLTQLAETLGVDVLVPISARAYLPSSLAARRTGRRCVLRLGIERYPFRLAWDWLIYGWLPDGVIVNAHRIERILSATIPFRRASIRVIRNGVKPLDAKPVRHAPQGRFVIASMGTLSYRKGFYHLLAAVSLLPQALRERVDVVIIGDGPSRQRLQWLASRLGLAEQVTFTGFLGNPAEVIAACDLFVLLSGREGISNALLEAMSAGRPVLATLAGGHGEFLVHNTNGYVAGSRWPPSIARALAAIITDERRPEVGQCGARTVREQFSIERMAAETEAFLLEVLDGTVRSAAARPEATV